VGQAWNLAKAGKSQTYPMLASFKLAPHCLHFITLPHSRSLLPLEDLDLCGLLD
jgi:hypothetical protein